MGIRTFFVEWTARRAGRKGMSRDLSRAAREVVGPTGWMWSKGWEKMAEDPSSYVESFDKKLPPSIFVSERDRKRHGMPIPLVERAIEDHKKVDLDLSELESLPPPDEHQ